MKKKILLGLAAGLLCVGAVGAVAADWVFSQNASKDQSVPVVVKPATEQGDITITGAGSLTLDQGGVANAADLTKGITYDWGTISADYVSDNEANAGTITRTFTITLDAKLAAYVEFVSGNTGTWTDANETALVVPVLKYKTDKKPLTTAAYTTMISDLGGSYIAGGDTTIASLVNVNFKAVAEGANA